MLSYASKSLPKTSAHGRTLSSLNPELSSSISLQKIWADDCFPDDLAPNSETTHDIVTSPPPAALTERPFPRSIALTYDEEAPIPRQPRVHKRSLTALLPFQPRTNSLSPERSPQRSPQQSPVKEQLDFDFMPTLTGDKDGQIKIEEKPKGGLSGWFSGTSAPVTMGIPVNEVEESIKLRAPMELFRSSSPEREPTKLRKRPMIPSMEPASPSKSPSATTSRFSFFGSPKTPTKQMVQIDSKLDDEFLNMDITAALFPSGSPKDQDPSSFSAFRNLVMNSEILFCRLQTAYKLRTLSLHELTAEKDAQTDELEEAVTRAKHLKFQLEDMACKMLEQDEAMKQVVEELMVEREARAEEKEARERSVYVVRSRGNSSTDSHSEDLHVERSQRGRVRRRSDGTSSSEVFESDNESSESRAESVFSRSMSPIVRSLSDMSSPEIGQAIVGKMVSNPAHTHRSTAVQQESNLTRIAGNEQHDSYLGMGLDECRNCRGAEASVAWDTVGLLKAENRGLKDRVEGLEKAVEGTLDLVAALGGCQ